MRLFLFLVGFAFVTAGATAVNKAPPKYKAVPPPQVQPKVNEAPKPVKPKVEKVAVVASPVNKEVELPAENLVYQGEPDLGELCNTTETCKDTNAECRDDGTNRNQERCICKGLYVGVGTECKLKISELDKKCTDINCSEAVGVCYDVDGSTAGCKCHLGRSGAECDKEYITTKCTADTMTICFEPFDKAYNARYETLKADMTAEKDIHLGARVFPEGKDQTTGCVFELDASGSGCQSGEWSLVFSTKKEDRDHCGTKRYIEETRLLYQNRLIVRTSQKSTEPGHQLLFNVYCSFATEETVGQLDGVNIDTKNAGETGFYNEAKVDMTIHNSIGAIIANGGHVDSGEEIKIQFELTTDVANVYKAIRVDACTASNKVTLGAPGALTLPIVIGGKPAPGQQHITTANMFEPIEAGKLTIHVNKAPLKVFRLVGDQLFFHCKVLICQDVTKCVYPTPFSHHRQRRSVKKEDGFVGLKRYVTVGAENYATKNSEMFKTKDLAIAVGIPVGFAMMVVLAMGSIFVVIMTRKQAKVSVSDAA